jgi:hypothetical protein
LPPSHPCDFLQLPDALPVARIKLTNAHITARGTPRHRSFIAADIGKSLWGNLPTLTAAPKPKALGSSKPVDPAVSSAGPV